ncbi:MAG: hypothetical protein HC822_06510 [Oscillochloris sp.]|nr:hypothetical protein [Oscillochloris sp.]
MSDRNYHDLAAQLRERVGAHVSGAENEGRRQLRKAVGDVLGVGKDEAQATLDQLISEGLVRYHPSSQRTIGADDENTDRKIQGGNAVEVASGGLNASVGAPVAIDDLSPEGYWEIGGANMEDMGEMGVRKGQVRPRGINE